MGAIIPRQKYLLSRKKEEKVGMVDGSGRSRMHDNTYAYANSVVGEEEHSHSQTPSLISRLPNDV